MPCFFWYTQGYIDDLPQQDLDALNKTCGIEHLSLCSTWTAVVWRAHLTNGVPRKRVFQGKGEGKLQD